MIAIIVSIAGDAHKKHILEWVLGAVGTALVVAIVIIPVALYCEVCSRHLRPCFLFSFQKKICLLQ